jgi:diguanylate cyclase (GGDEF)-like protein
MKLKGFFRNFRPDPSKRAGSYQDSLIHVTKLGTLFTAVFFIAFILIYWLGGYPRLAVWVNLAAVLCSITGYILNTRFGLYRINAHLVTFAIYLSSAGVMAISGGIHSSSVIWQVFVPVAAFIMAGLWAGLRWGIFCLITVMTFYALEAHGITSFPGFKTSTVDLLLDLAGAIFAVSIASWYSDHLKSHSITQLEETQAQLNYFATVDPLTNTFNRRHFLEQSERRIQRIYTDNGYASFLLFDIDHFKRFNDAHGHIIGDQILRGVAQTCIKYIRPDDILGRFGGEEFVILLPDTNVGDASNIAERLRVLIQKTPIETDIGPVSITISIGVAVMERAAIISLDQLLFRADEAMYLAKRAGRNRVVIWDEKSPRTT